ncbi:MAG: sulfite exporter TauE/SafE family protein [Brockia lithotrophica]|nr:sulfite exporter TauE/SafE family protein [Brockia lithotrophica]
MNISLGIAFVSGLVAFFSPCVFPLYPSFLAYVTGVSAREVHNARGARLRARVVLHSLLFALGLSTIYFLLGFGASFLGQLFFAYQDLIARIGGALILLMGLVVMGVVHVEFLERTFQFRLGKSGSTLGAYVRSYLVGLLFGAGWTPCVSPILGGIFALAATQPAQATALMLAFSLGFAGPFVLFGFFLSFVTKLAAYTPLVARIGGALLVLTGILLMTGQFGRLSLWLG